MNQPAPSSALAGKSEVQTLLTDAATMGVDRGLAVDRLRGTAFFDTERDELLTSLPSFEAARLAVINIPNFSERIGSEEAKRIVLQLAYQYFERVYTVEYQEAAFEALWRDFMAEIQDANWRVRGVANIRNFHSESHPIDLVDGVAIRGRSRTDLASLGFDAAVWEGIKEDWRGFGASSFVLVAEDSFARQPDNLIMLDTYTVSRKATRAIMALRLAAAGSIGVGPMWVVRPARFNVGLGGLTSTGAAIPMLGSRYSWTNEVGHVYPSIYDALAKLETDGYHQSPGNLAVALREFAASYDSWPARPDSQLLDCITALEALLGTDTEISFKLSFRVAALLATNNDKRSDLLRLMKKFYETRSKLVHGASLKKKQQDMLQRVDELRSIVRQLLRAFIRLSVTPKIPYNKEFWDDLDAALVNSTEREKLRTALGLKHRQNRERT